MKFESNITSAMEITNAQEIHSKVDSKLVRNVYL